MSRTMIISKIKNEKYIYYDLHCEEVMIASYSLENIDTVSQGIYIDRLQTNTLKNVIEDIILNYDKTVKIVLNFKYINAIQQNLNQTLNILITKGYKIVLINVLKEVVSELGYTEINNLHHKSIQKNYIDNITKENVNKTLFVKFYLFEEEDNFIDDSFKDYKLFKDEFQLTIKEFIEDVNEPHTSSFVYLKSFVDIKKFISLKKKLTLHSIYRLAIKVNNEWKTDIDKDPILICQSLNSSYFVSMLSNLLQLDILILDKIGPINKLYNRLDKTISSTRQYIVVSDMVCLGTEVKIVKNLIEFIGGKYLGNVSLIKTETLKKNDIKKKDATIAVFSIDKSNNRELNYYITTELETKDE